MKHRATIDLEFTNGDLFDQEVIKAMRAYAKTIAREAFQSEIQEAVVDTTRIWAKRLYESRYTEPMTDKLVRAEVESYIKEQMKDSDVRKMIQSTVTKEITELQNEVRGFVKAEFEKYLTSSFVADAIQKAIKESVPQAVFEALMKSTKG